MSLSDVNAYFRRYDRSRMHVVACQGNEPTEADVSAFEATIGFRLPPQFREFTMSPLGGLYVEAREELWPPAKRFQVGPFWTFLRALKVFGIAKGIPDWLDIRAQYRQHVQPTGADSLVPFMQREGDANCWCFTKTGAIVLWDHEDPNEPRPVEQDFHALLLVELAELEARIEKKLELGMSG